MTLHADACRLLETWSAPDAGQEVLRQAYLRHLSDHADGMWRSCVPDHVTASALIVDAVDQRVLLTLHRRLGRWLQTGGHCEPGDTMVAAAARRESQEESGMAALVVDPQPVLLSRHEVPCGPLRPAHHLDVQFVAVASSDAEPRCSDESDDVAWFRADRLPNGADASVRALAQQALQRVAP